MEEFIEAQQNQERMRGVLHDSRESVDNAFIEMQSPCHNSKSVGTFMIWRAAASRMQARRLPKH